MSAVPRKLPALNEALQKANTILTEKGYAVAITNEEIKSKEPIFLQLQYTDGKTQNIGITHLVHLKGSDWDNQPFETLARTTDQVVQAILDRVNLFFEAKQRDLYIDEKGTIFDFNKISVKILPDNTFSINGRVVIFEEQPLSLAQIKSENIIEFRQLENGRTGIFNFLIR